MIRTQVSLPKIEYLAAKKEAQKMGVSLAEFFRRALSHHLPVNKSQPWMNYCGFVETGDLNSSQRIDEIIYGQKD